MSLIKINRKVLETTLGKKLSPEFLEKNINLMGVVLENCNEEELEIEIFPSRPDMLSEQGFARSFASFIGTKTSITNYTVKKSNLKVIIDSSVKEVRPFTACAIVKNIKFDDLKIKEIISLQEKLHITFGRNRKKAAIGIYPLDKISFPITFKADKPEKIIFTPLEAKKAMNALQILSQHPTGRDYAHLLEGKVKFPYFIDSKNEILSMPPIINSNLTGRVTNDTKDVFIECSGFDYETLSICLNIIVTSLADMGGDIFSLELVDGKSKLISPDLSNKKMKFNLDYMNKRLGLNLKQKEVRSLLQKMGLGYDKGTVIIPAYRADIIHQVDLVEDVAIAYGYDNFEESIPNVATLGEEDPSEKFFDKIREILIGLNLIECKNLHLMTEKELNQNMNLKQELIQLKNALGDYNHLRNSILPSLLKNLQENQHNEYPQNIFEIGRIFYLEPTTETGIGEQDKLGIVLCDKDVDFTQIKQILDYLIHNLGLKAIIKESDNFSYIPGRVGNIYINNIKIGLIGEISPLVLTNWNVLTPTVGLEINLEELYKIIYS